MLHVGSHLKVEAGKRFPQPLPFLLAPYLLLAMPYSSPLPVFLGYFLNFLTPIVDLTSPAQFYGSDEQNQQIGFLTMRKTPQITGMPKEGGEPAVESTVVIIKNVQRLIEHLLAKQPRRSGIADFLVFFS